MKYSSETPNSYKKHTRKLTNLHYFAQGQTLHELAHGMASNSRPQPSWKPANSRPWVSSIGLAASKEQQSNEQKSSSRMILKCLQTSLKKGITLTHEQ